MVNLSESQLKELGLELNELGFFDYAIADEFIGEEDCELRNAIKMIYLGGILTHLNHFKNNSYSLYDTLLYKSVRSLFDRVAHKLYGEENNNGYIDRIENMNAIGEYLKAERKDFPKLVYNFFHSGNSFVNGVYDKEITLKDIKEIAEFLKQYDKFQFKSFFKSEVKKHDN